MQIHKYLKTSRDFRPTLPMKYIEINVPMTFAKPIIKFVDFTLIPVFEKILVVKIFTANAPQNILTN